MVLVMNVSLYSSPQSLRNKEQKMMGKRGAYLLKENNHFYQKASRSGKTDHGLMKKMMSTIPVLPFFLT